MALDVKISALRSRIKPPLGVCLDNALVSWVLEHA